MEDAIDGTCVNPETTADVGLEDAQTSSSSLEGWVCPHCGRVFSPWIHMCFWCDSNSGDCSREQE